MVLLKLRHCHFYDGMIWEDFATMPKHHFYQMALTAQKTTLLLGILLLKIHLIIGNDSPELCNIGTAVECRCYKDASNSSIVVPVTTNIMSQQCTDFIDDRRPIRGVRIELYSCEYGLPQSIIRARIAQWMMEECNAAIDCGHNFNRGGTTAFPKLVIFAKHLLLRFAIF